MNVFVNKRTMKLQGTGDRPLPPPPPPEQPPQGQGPPPEQSQSSVEPQQPSSHQSPHAPPPPPPKKAMPIMAIVVVIMVVIAAIAVAFIFMGDGNAQEDPDSAFNGFIDNYLDEDEDGSLKFTDASFFDSKDLKDLDDEMGWSEDPENDDELKDTIIETEMIGEDDMDPLDKEAIEKMVEAFEDEYDVTVEDFCILEWNADMTYIDEDGDEYTEDDSGEWPMMQIDDKWYVMMHPDVYIDGNEIAQMSPEWTTTEFFELFTFEDPRPSSDLSIISFDEKYEEILDGISAFMMGFNYSVTVQNVEARYLSDMSDSEILATEHVMNLIEDEYFVTIDEYCMVDFMVTVEMSFAGYEDVSTESDNMACFLVDDKWYLDIHYVNKFMYYDTPTGMWSSIEAESLSEATVTFGAFSDDVAPTDIQLYVYEDAALWGVLSWSSDHQPAPATLYGAPPGTTATYTDFNAAGGLINSGDYIKFTGFKSGSIYSFEVFYTPTEQMIQMAGDLAILTMP